MDVNELPTLHFRGLICDFSKNSVCPDLDEDVAFINRRQPSPMAEKRKVRYKKHALGYVATLHSSGKYERRKNIAYVIQNRYPWQRPIWDSIVRKTKKVFPRAKIGKIPDGRPIVIIPIQQKTYPVDIA